MSDGSEGLQGAAALLALLQLSDGALPIGRHAHAMGLERLLREGMAEDPGALRALVAAALTHGAARADAAAAAHACDALRARDLDALIAVDLALDALKLTASAQAASRRCGRRLAALAPSLVDDPLLASYAEAVRADAAPGHLAVVSAACAAAAGAARAHAVVTELRGVAAMLLSAAVRLGALNATAAQTILAGLAPEIVSAARVALETAVDDMGCAAAAGFEVAAMRHARDHGRLFAT